MRKSFLLYFTTLITVFTFVPVLSLVHASPVTVDPGVGNIPQGTQSNTACASSFNTHHVTNPCVISSQMSYHS